MQLIVEQGSRAGQIVPLQREPIVVGRGEGCGLQLSETGVSRQHARLQYGPQGWSVVDLGSTNGTFVNGRRLPANQPYLLRPGDRIAVGNTVLLVQPGDVEHAAPEEALQREAPRGRPRPVVLAVGAVALVVVLVGIVILLVTLLQPEAEPATPTVAGPMDQITTAFPVPTGFQGVMTSVVTILPTDFPVLPFGPKETPTPEAVRPGREMARSPVLPAVPVPLPEPPGQVEGENGLP